MALPAVSLTIASSLFSSSACSSLWAACPWLLCRARQGTRTSRGWFDAVALSPFSGRGFPCWLSVPLLLPCCWGRFIPAGLERRGSGGHSAPPSPPPCPRCYTPPALSQLLTQGRGLLPHAPASSSSSSQPHAARPRVLPGFPAGCGFAGRASAWAASLPPTWCAQV